MTSDFPGGSALVREIDQTTRTIRLLPNTPADRGFVCWWYFKLEGAEVGSTITLEVGPRGFAFPDQAQFSYDNRTWQQTEPGVRKGSTLIVYRHKVTASVVWFAWGPPFVAQDANDLLAEVCRSHSFAKRFELARSREARSVPGVRIAEQAAAGEMREAVWIQARQHAWESGSSWVGRGFVLWAISDDPAAQALRRRAEIFFIPIMDVDNVEHGFGGKSQKPRDHYWDWDDAPHFPEVGAAIQRIKTLDAEGRLRAFVDLHNPGPTDRNLMFFVPARPLLTPERLKTQDAFLAVAREEMTGPMGFLGQLGRIGATYDPVVDTACDCWIAHHCRPTALALTMETPWNTPTSTIEGYRQTGEQLGRSLERFLRESSSR